MRDESIYLIELLNHPNLTDTGRLLVYRRHLTFPLEFWANGDLSVLIQFYAQCRTDSPPIGIVIDRIEEFPNELQATPEQVAEIVRWLRLRYPNGV